MLTCRALAGAPTAILFFTGKGGVGKTSLACATAIELADAGRRTLLVSTDPASNLGEVLNVRLRSDPTPVPGVAGLLALDIDPVAAAQAYRDRVIGPYRQLLPAATVARMEEQLSGACTTEIAAFDEFTRLLGAAETWVDWDHVVFDTAPTGHTLRLLSLPAAWDTFIDTNATGTSCLGPLSGLSAQQATYKASLAALCDPGRTTVVLVSRPDRAALAEADRTRAELTQLGITHQQLVVNAVFAATDRGDPIASALEARGRAALAAIPGGLEGLPRRDVPLLLTAPMGVHGLRQVFDPQPAVIAGVDPPLPMESGDRLAALVRDLAASGRGVILTMGKGGVGKTTVAAAVAFELARLGHRVHLSTTDPAAHLDATLAGEGGAMTVSRIDPIRETRAYTEEVLAAATTLDAQGQALLEEDLRSPCTEEIAVFRAFARTVAEGADRFVVLDTAPTGHTLLLLDAAEAYHRDVARTQSEVPEEVRQLLPRLRDPAFTHVLLVTVPEATPVHEAAQLQEDLRRAGIHPAAWIVNQSFAATSTTDPVLLERASRERSFIAEVQGDFADRMCVLPWQAEPPVGRAALLALAAAGGPACALTATS
ncbi:MAG TPA: arsenical pump-driving ATPase [Vicinamibacteria bacterium]|nr:arsenical pump-driving ATPase [Vicinamibacteria bacterium]